MVMDFYEPATVPDVFASGLGDAEDLQDGNMRFTFFTRQKTPRGFELIVVARIIMPVAAVHCGIKMTMTEMGVSCCGVQRLRVAN